MPGSIRTVLVNYVQKPEEEKNRWLFYVIQYVRANNLAVIFQFMDWLPEIR